MQSIRNLLSATLLSAGAVVAASSMSIATAADVTPPPPPPAGAPGAPGPHGWHHHRGPGHLFAKLGLSDAQKEQIKTIMTAARPQMQSLHEQMQTQRAEVRAQVYKVLTPAQQSQLTALEAQMRAGKHGRWGGPPPGEPAAE